MVRRFAAELVGTFALVLFAVGAAVGGIDRIGPVGVALAFGFVLLALVYTIGVHLVGIPLDSTSVNPARSLGPALFAGGQALGQVWLFVVAPLVGAAVAAGLFRLLPAAGVERA